MNVGQSQVSLIWPWGSRKRLWPLLLFPFLRSPIPAPSSGFTLQGSLPSGADSPVDDGRSEVTITECCKCCRSHLNLWRADPFRIGNLLLETGGQGWLLGT